MKIIWKYPIEVTDTQVVMLPKGSQILSVQVQRNVPTIWVVVNPDLSVPRFARTLRMFGTGHEISEIFEIRYIGTFQLRDGELVFHLFEDL